MGAQSKSQEAGSGWEVKDSSSERDCLSFGEAREQPVAQTGRMGGVTRRGQALKDSSGD